MYKKLLHLICFHDDYFKDLRITIIFSALNFADDFALDPDGTSVWDLEAVAAKWKLEKLSLKKEYFNTLKNKIFNQAHKKTVSLFYV